MAVLSFYGDESGSHGDGPFVLAGYLARDDDWGKFAESWHSALHAGLLEIDYFHMRECFKRTKQFDGFNRAQADRKLNAVVDSLCPFLRSGRLVEFTSILDWGIFKRTVETGPLKSVYHNPYFFGLHAIVAEIANFLGHNSDWAGDAHGPVDFFFDDQNQRIEADTKTQFNNVKETVSEQYVRFMGEVDFRNDEINYPLQAADLIAWQMHRRELNLAEDLHKPRKEYTRLRNATTHGKLMRCREDGIQALSDRISAGLRSGIWE